VRPIAIAALTVALSASPAYAADIAKTADQPVTAASLAQKVARYLPKNGQIVSIRQATRRVIHIEVIEKATPENDWFGLPPEFWKQIPDDAEWDTTYTVRFGKRQVLLCVGGMGVIRRFGR